MPETLTPLDALLNAVREMLAIYGVSGIPANDGYMADVFIALAEYDASPPVAVNPSVAEMAGLLDRILLWHTTPSLSADDTFARMMDEWIALRTRLPVTSGETFEEFAKKCEHNRPPLMPVEIKYSMCTNSNHPCSDRQYASLCDKTLCPIWSNP